MLELIDGEFFFYFLLSELKKSANTTMYRQVTEKGFELYGGDFTLDQGWIDNVDRKSATTQDKLDADLTNFKTQLARDSIRVIIRHEM